MGDGRLGSIDNFKYRIELTAPDVRLINTAPYRSGSKAGEFQEAETGEMLCMNLTEPAQSK